MTRLLVVVLVLVLVLAPTVRGVTLDAGTVLRPPSGWTDFEFSTAREFATVEVRPTDIVLDSVTVQLGKSPGATPYAEIVVAAWRPTGGDPRIAYTETAEIGAWTWLNLTGLVDGRYRVLVDGQPYLVDDAGPSRTLRIEYRAWAGTAHTFAIEIAHSGGVLPPTTEGEEIVLGTFCIGGGVLVLIMALLPWRRRRGR